MGDLLGASVGIERDPIVPGAPLDDIGANAEGLGQQNADQGSAHTFARGAGARTETAKLTAADGGAGDLLGNSVAIECETIVVGAPGQ